METILMVLAAYWIGRDEISLALGLDKAFKCITSGNNLLKMSIMPHASIICVCVGGSGLVLPHEYSFIWLYVLI